MARRALLSLIATVALVAILLAQPVRAQDTADLEATVAALQTQVATLSGAATSTPTPATEQVAGPTTPTGGPVNIEIILDDSGSMGQVIDTGETRLDAAKRVLSEVAAAIPDRPGVNVGLRVYGRGGDNTETGKAASCESSELVVPLSGIDRGKLAEEMVPLVPTGWTPIALALQRSAADFPDTPDATNAIVLVTDGLETCGGDPAEIAGALASGPDHIVTHVIGFAVTPEEQEILQGITQQSGGLLLGANNATELTGALFKILEQLDVVKGAGLVGGSALSLLPPGEPGKLSVVAVGPYDGRALPFVVRNNTGEPLLSPSATARALNPAGQMIATGGDQGIHPNLIRPGGLALGYVYLSGVQLAPDTTFDVEVTAKPPKQVRYEGKRDLNVEEAVFTDGRIVGTLSNPYNTTLTGPFQVQFACFDAAGQLTTGNMAFAETKEVAPGGTVPFQVPSYGEIDCPLFLVAGGGYDLDFNSRSHPADILTPAAPPAVPLPPTTPSPASTLEVPAAKTTPPSGVDSDTSSATASSPTAHGCYDLSTAAAVLVALKAEGLPIGDSVDYTVETDPNEKMGRPGGYTSKVNFRDFRLVPESDDFATRDGGSIEVFATAADRETRANYLEAISKAVPLAGEDVMFSQGRILLRVSNRLLIPDSDAYGVALEKIVNCAS